MRAMKNVQYGFSMWEAMFYLGMLGFVLTCALKLGPHYMDDRNIAEAMRGVHESLQGKDVFEIKDSDIRSRMGKFFQVSMLPDELLKEIEVEREAGKVILRLNYETRDNFMGNVDVVLRFEHEVDLASLPE